MKYVLMIHGDERAFASMSEAAMGQAMAAYGAYTEALVSAGIMRGGERLQPSSTATTVRVVDGKTSLLDGPYAEIKEQLGGFYIIEVETLDSALTWAARCPGAAHGTIEVRPLYQM